jgi:DNA invertase Pin-like site-specific DNA recombinase
MSETPPVPAELHDWLRSRREEVAGLLAALDRAGRADERVPYTMDTLKRWAEVEQHAKRAVHLLTAYALRERMVTATEVARSTGVTVTAAQSRVASRTATEVWDEAFGR